MDPRGMWKLFELNGSPSIGSSGRLKFGSLGDPIKERAVWYLVISFGFFVWPIFGVFASEVLPVGLGDGVLVENLLPGFQKSEVDDVTIGSYLICFGISDR